jgi:hypothetical protein
MTTATRRRRPGIPVEKTAVEYLILADFAEALGGKLYLMGGGWDSVKVADFSRPVPMSIACGISVPWNATDDEHRLTLAITDQDGVTVAPELQASFKTGRSPQLERGHPAHVPFAIKAELLFPGAGTYVVAATVDGDETSRRKFAFHIRPA